MNKSKILIITDHYLPGYKAGGPIVSIQGIVDIVKEMANIIIITKDRDFGDLNQYPGVNIDKYNAFDGYSIIYSQSIISRLKYINSIKPDVIYINSLFSSFSLSLFLYSVFCCKKSLRIIAPRGELGSGALAIKNTKKKIFLFIFCKLRLGAYTRFHSTSIGEYNDILNNVGSKSLIISNIPFSIKFKSCSIKKSGEVRLIYLSRISKKKNLHFAIESLKKITNYRIIYDIYGPIEDLKYWEMCKKIIALLPSNILVNYCGEVERERISTVFYGYHGFLFPTANENYGHAIIESMQCGVLPIISDQTPWNDLESLNVGWSVPIHDKSYLINSIRLIALLDQNKFNQMSEGVVNYAKRAVNASSHKEQYLSMFELD